MAPNPTRPVRGEVSVVEEDEPCDVKDAWVDKYKYTGHELIWRNVILISFVHAYAVYCLPYLLIAQWSSIAWATLVLFAVGFGVTAGAHRLWTHRSYKAKLPLRVALMLCFAAAGQNPIYDWVRDHRVHHKFSETDADPHNVNRGFFFAHVGWLMKRKHPEVRRRGQQVDMSDILNDPVCKFQRKYYFHLMALCCFIFPTAVPVVFWGEKWSTAFALNWIRYVFALNNTWSVNSAAHLYGDKPFDRRIAPVENPIVSIFALGEGWHNFHHVFPWDYKAAEFGYINLTKNLLDMFARIGLVYDRKTASDDLVRKVARRFGDGTHHSGPEAVPEIPEEAASNPDLVDTMNLQQSESTDSSRIAVTKHRGE